MLLSILRRIARKRLSSFAFLIIGVVLSLPFRTAQQEGGGEGAGEYGNDGLGPNDGRRESERDIPGELPEEEGHCTERNVTEYEIVAVEWVEVYIPYIIIIWIMMATLAKLGEFCVAI